MLLLLLLVVVWVCSNLVAMGVEWVFIRFV